MKTKRILALEERRDALVRKLEEMDDVVIERGSDLNETEQATYDAHSTELSEVTNDLKTLVERAALVDESTKLGNSLGAATNANGGRLIVREADKQIYRADDVSSPNFFADLIRSKNGFGDASQRITQHMEIERTGATSSDLAGIVVPRYTTDLVDIAREGRPFLNVLRNAPVTSASVILPRVTTGGATAAQNGENVAFATASLDTEEVTVNTVTVAGYTDVSVQAVEFGALPQDWIMQQLLADLYTRMDYYALNGLGTSGQPEGLFEADGTNVVDADSVSAFAEHYAAVVQAASLIRTNQFVTPTHVVMSPARWYALLSATDADGRPLAGILGSSPVNVGGNTQVQGGVFAGLPVVVDQNVVRSGEDDTFMGVVHAPSIWFAESTPVRLVCDCVVGHTGTVRFILRAYMQFSAEIRPKAVTIIQDLTVPEFPTLAIS